MNKKIHLVIQKNYHPVFQWDINFINIDCGGVDDNSSSLKLIISIWVINSVNWKNQVELEHWSSGKKMRYISWELDAKKFYLQKPWGESKYLQDQTIKKT